MSKHTGSLSSTDEKIDPQARASPPTTRRRSSENQFPGKLHDMLTFVTDHDLESVISWVRNGTAIMIHNPPRLTEILPMFFGQTKYRSFRRQLNMWHFRRLLTGPDQGAFLHPFFIEGRRSLCTYMSRHINPHACVEPSPLFVADSKLPAAAGSGRLMDDHSWSTASSSSSPAVAFRGGSPKDTNADDIEELEVWNLRRAKSVMSQKEGFTKNSTMASRTNVLNDKNKKLEKVAGVAAIMTKMNTSQGIKHDDATHRMAASFFPLTSDPTSVVVSCQQDRSQSPTTATAAGIPNTGAILEAICPGLSIPATPEAVESIFNELSEFEFQTNGSWRAGVSYEKISHATRTIILPWLVVVLAASSQQIRVVTS